MANKLAHEVRNKYTVHGKLAALQSAVEQLEAAQLRLKAELLSELTIYAEAHFHGKNGADGKDGNDCQCREVQGPKGERGDVCYIGPAETEAAVAAVRAELLRFRAHVIGRIVHDIEDCKKMGTRGHSQYVVTHFEKLLRDIEKDIAAQEAKAAR